MSLTHDFTFAFFCSARSVWAASVLATSVLWARVADGERPQDNRPLVATRHDTLPKRQGCAVVERVSTSARVGVAPMYVEPQAVAYGRGRLFVLGNPVAIADSGSPQGMRIARAAGAIVSAEGRASIVPLPGQHRLTGARALYKPGVGWHVLWLDAGLAARSDSMGISQRGVVTYAFYDGKSWSRPRPVSGPRQFLANPASMSRMVSTARGFAVALPIRVDNGDTSVVVIANDGGHWREIVVPKTTDALYADLVAPREKLVLVYAG